VCKDYSRRDNSLNQNLSDIAYLGGLREGMGIDFLKGTRKPIICALLSWLPHWETRTHTYWEPPKNHDKPSSVTY
jgi:hypothetical protein